MRSRIVSESNRQDFQSRDSENFPAKKDAVSIYRSRFLSLALSISSHGETPGLQLRCDKNIPTTKRRRNPTRYEEPWSKYLASGNFQVLVALDTRARLNGIFNGHRLSPGGLADAMAGERRITMHN